MELTNKLKGVAYLGARNLLESARYGLTRAARTRTPRDARFGTPLNPPGPLRDVSPVERGARLRFGGAELEVLFLAEDIARLTWLPGQLPAPYLVAAGEWALTAPVVERSDAGVSFQTERLRLRVASDGAVTLLDAGGVELRRELPPLGWNGRWVHRAALRPEEHCYGLGLRNLPLDVRGHTVRFWNTDPKGAYLPGQDPIYVCIPVCIGLHGDGSFLVFFENTRDGEMRFSDEGEVHTEFAGGALRYYLIPGPIEQALARYHDLTGRAPLPPRWALGFHQSRWSYMNEQDVRALVDAFHAHDLPLSAVHLDIHYMDDYRVFTTDLERFPDLARLADDLSRANVGLVTILDPGIAHDADYDVCQEALDGDHVCRYPDATPVVAPVWPGNCLFPDFTRAETRAWWGDRYRFFVDAGIDGVWHDMNEPSAFTPVGDPTLPRDTRHDMDGQGGDHVEAHNVYALLEARAGFEGLSRLRPKRRPWILSRAGTAGLQRYAWNWTGDSESTWDGLRLSIVHALGLGLSGIPFTGSDVGGFGGSPSPELFVRWLQSSAFMPFFRVHSAFFTPPREPWAFGEPVLSIVRDWLKRRYALLPYFYSVAWEVATRGVPWVRPLFWGEQTNRSLWDVQDAFLAGDALLVAPVVEPAQTRRTVPLPSGSWYDYWTGEQVEAAGMVELDAPLERIPVLVRGGTILPAAPGERLELHVYPGLDGTARGFRYDDPGDGHGFSRIERYELRRDDDISVLTRTFQGDFPFTFEGIELIVHGMTVQDVLVDGVPATSDGGRIRLDEFDRVQWTGTQGEQA